MKNIAKRMRDFFSSFLLLELLRGLALTGRRFFERKITVQFPEEKTPRSSSFSRPACPSSLSDGRRALYCLQIV